MASMPGTSEGRSTPASSLSGLPSGTTRPGCGAVSAASAAEQKVLAMASWKPAASRVRRTADSASAQGRALNAFAESGQGVGETVVAVDAGDFFDEVDFALEVEAPAGQGDVPCASLRLRGVSRAAERGENVFDSGGGDAFLVDGRAEDALHFAEREGDGLAMRGARLEGGDAHIDQIAFDLAAVGEQDAADERRGDGAALKSAPRSKRWLASVCRPWRRAVRRTAMGSNHAASTSTFFVAGVIMVSQPPMTPARPSGLA